MWTATTDLHARGDLAHVVHAHHDQPALRELRAPRIDDGDPRAVGRDRLGDALVPDSVACKIEIVENEAADWGERLCESTGPVARRHPSDVDAAPFQLVGHSPRIEPDVAQRLLVLGLTQDGNVPRHELLGPGVEVVAMAVGDEHRVDVADDVFGSERQWDERVGSRVARTFDGRPGAGVVERRVYEQPLAGKLDDHRRIANERQTHEPTSIARDSGLLNSAPWLY